MVADLLGRAQQALFEAVVQPLVFAAGQGALLEDAYDTTGWLILGLLQILVLLAVIRPLERWRPVEPMTGRPAIRVDMIYTLIHRLGLFRLLMFFTVDPLADALTGWLALHGLGAWQIDQVFAPWWPGVTDTALTAFVAYLLALDLADYAIHRAQHRFDWWWTLHAVHHSQRQMTM